MTCCDHETEEKETAKCGQFLDCESICMSKDKSVCPTGICTSDRYDCDPEGGKYIEDPDNETDDCDCKDCPITDCPSCCYNENCIKLKPKTCALKLTAFSGNITIIHIYIYIPDITTMKPSGLELCMDGSKVYTLTQQNKVLLQD